MTVGTEHIFGLLISDVNFDVFNFKQYITQYLKQFQLKTVCG